MTVVAVSGYFDPLHVGHLEYSWYTIWLKIQDKQKFFLQQLDKINGYVKFS